MSNLNNVYKVIFHPECLNQLERFGSLEELDPALSEVVYALETDPYRFEHSPQYPNWIVVITRRHLNKAAKKQIPSLRLYAAIIEAKKQVKIMDVRINPDDRNLYM